MSNNIKPASQWSQNYVQGMQGATGKYTQGVQGVNESPTVAAARKLDAYLAGVQQAVSSGLMARRLQSVSLQSWQQAAIKKGAPRLATGASAAKGKVDAFAQKAAPIFANLQSTVNQMPSDTTDQRIQKAVAWMQGLSQQKGNFK